MGDIVQARAAGEDAAFDAYRRVLSALWLRTIDDRMQFEDLLLDWVLSSPRPGLLVFIDAAARFGWDGKMADICDRFGPGSEKKIESLHSLARLYLEGRCSSVGWCRALFSASATSRPLPRIGCHFQLVRARQLAAAWEQLCARSAMPQLLGLMDSRLATHYRRGFILGSVNLWLAAIVALVLWNSLALESPMAPMARVGAVALAAVLAFFGPAVLNAQQLRINLWLGATGRGIQKIRGEFADAPRILLQLTITLIGFVSVMLMAVLFDLADRHGVSGIFVALAILVIGVIAAFVARLAWPILVYVDAVMLSTPLRWIDNTQRYLLAREMEKGVAQPTAWGMLTLLQAIPLLWFGRDASRKATVAKTTKAGKVKAVRSRASRPANDAKIVVVLLVYLICGPAYMFLVRPHLSGWPEARLDGMGTLIATLAPPVLAAFALNAAQKWYLALEERLLRHGPFIPDETV